MIQELLIFQIFHYNRSAASLIFSDISGIHECVKVCVEGQCALIEIRYVCVVHSAAHKLYHVLMQDK